MLKNLMLALNLFALFALFGVSLVYGLWPDQLAAVGLRGESAKVLMLQLISLMFLLAAFQGSLEPGWRKFSMVACFVVLGQSLLMSALVPW